MTKAPISLQDLRRKIYLKAKADKAWRFWGLYVHVCKMETLQEAYRMAKRNNGAPGIDGVTFDAIEAAGLEAFLEGIHRELVSGTYRPMRNRRQSIPKDKGKVRILGIPTIRDRVVQGALKLILEPVFEADFQARVVWISTQADCPCGSQPGSGGSSKKQNPSHRCGPQGLL